MTRSFWPAALAGAILLGGCASNHRQPAAKSPGSMVLPAAGPTGTVVSVNAALRFTVLSFPLGQMPALDSRLGVYRQGQKVGEIRITGPERDENVVADILAGDLQKGDEVRPQ